MRIICIIIALIVSISSINAFAWNDGKNSTHEKITFNAIINSELENYFNNNLDLSIGRSIEGKLIDGDIEEKLINEWLNYGSMKEDSPMCRASSHFHDPTKPWGYSGMTTLGSLVTGICEKGYFGGNQYPPSEIKSAIFYATGYLEPSPNGYNDVDNNNDWDWDNARNYYHIYLTGEDVSGDQMASNIQEREQYFGQSLRALGQVLHLLQDMSVPAHTRDDFMREYGSGHADRHWWPYEGTFLLHGEELEVFVATYSEKNTGWFVPSSVPPDSDFSLTDFWDQNVYTKTNPESTWADPVGLAEFSNANFITEASVKDYPHPDVTIIDWDLMQTIIAEDGNPDDRIYLMHNGTYSYPVAAPGYFTKDLETYAVGQIGLKKDSLVVDDVIKHGYAKILIPKAISYSSALIDYFFRGEIDLVRSGADFKILNKTDEEMDGKFGLYYDNDNNERIQLISGDFPLQTIIPPDGESQTVSFTEPSDAKEPGIYILVFKGKLGNESDAVVGKVYNRKCFSIILTDGSKYIFNQSSKKIEPDNISNANLPDTHMKNRIVNGYPYNYEPYGFSFQDINGAVWTYYGRWSQYALNSSPYYGSHTLLNGYIDAEVFVFTKNGMIAEGFPISYDGNTLVMEDYPINRHEGPTNESVFNLQDRTYIWDENENTYIFQDAQGIENTFWLNKRMNNLNFDQGESYDCITYSEKWLKSHRSGGLYGTPKRYAGSCLSEKEHWGPYFNLSKGKMGEDDIMTVNSAFIDEACDDFNMEFTLPTGQVVNMSQEYSVISPTERTSFAELNYAVSYSPLLPFTINAINPYPEETCSSYYDMGGPYNWNAKRACFDCGNYTEPHCVTTSSLPGRTMPECWGSAAPTQQVAYYGAHGVENPTRIVYFDGDFIVMDNGETVVNEKVRIKMDVFARKGGSFDLSSANKFRIFVAWASLNSINDQRLVFIHNNNGSSTLKLNGEEITNDVLNQISQLRGSTISMDDIQAVCTRYPD